MPSHYSALEALAEACRVIGSRVPLWNQGAGGNLSFKAEGRLWVKASGARLDQVTARHGLVAVDLAGLRDRLSRIRGEEGAEEAYAAALVAAKDPASEGRPSMETGFHALLPGRFVAHFHSLPGILMAGEGPSFERWAAGATKLKLGKVDAIRPGWKLTQGLGRWENVDAILLENHGVILQSDDDLSLDRGALKEWAALEVQFCRERGYDRLLRLCSAGAWNAVGAPPPAPARCFFPDAAVFADRLRAVRTEAARGRELRYAVAADGWTRDRDAAEIWLATQFLFEARPELRELPDAISSTVASLPTEAHRQRVTKG